MTDSVQPLSAAELDALEQKHTPKVFSDETFADDAILRRDEFARLLLTCRASIEDRERLRFLLDGGYVVTDEDDGVLFVKRIGHGDDWREDERVGDLMVRLNNDTVRAPQDVERFLDAASGVSVARSGRVAGGEHG